MTMITRITNIDQLADAQLQVLGVKFFQEGGLPGKFDGQTFIKWWSRFLGDDYGAMWTAQRDGYVIGAIGGLIHPNPYDGDLVAQEMFWFMDPSHRVGSNAIRLYREFEKWSIQRGAKRIVMANICNRYMTKLRKFYERLGYRAVDVSYFKDL